MVEINKQNFSQLIIDPEKISVNETHALKDIINNYPYFTVARIIELIGLKKHNSIRFNSAIETCSLFSTERGVLKDLIEFGKIVRGKQKNDKILYSRKTKNSFIKWLKMAKPVTKNPISNKTIIENFLESKPGISINKKSSKINLANIHKVNKKEYMTETLAKLYFKQRKFKKAVKAYEILCLKYPEKITLFANQIKIIKKQQKNNQS